jgi:hypothetical protein
MRSNQNGLRLGFAALLAVAGCSNVDTPSEKDYDDIAQALGSVTATESGGGEIGTMVDASTIATGAPRIGIDLEGSGSFSGNRVGLQYEYSITCKDGAGTTLDACSDASDSAAVNVKWAGDLTTTVLIATIARQGKLELSNIQSGPVEISGTSTLRIDAHLHALLQDAQRSYTLKYSASYEDLKVQRAPAQMLGGKIHYALEVDRNKTSRSTQKSAHYEIDAELVFDANGKATLTLDGDHRYAVDTGTGNVENVNAQP